MIKIFIQTISVSDIKKNDNPNSVTDVIVNKKQEVPMKYTL